jgi:DNA polymerase III delta subunit
MLILHGDNLILSRQALMAQKNIARQKNLEVVELAAKNLELSDLKQALESFSMFGSSRLVVIENLFSIPKSKTRDQLLDYLKTAHFVGEVIIWEKKTIDGRTLRAFSNRAKVLLFKLSPWLFKFLDSFQPQQPKMILSLFHQTTETEPVEMVFYLFCRRIRDLIIARDLGYQGLAKMAPWQRTKLVSQAKKFTLSELLGLYRRLLKVDQEQKTGLAVLPLEQTLDVLFAGF